MSKFISRVNCLSDIDLFISVPTTPQTEMIAITYETIMIDNSYFRKLLLHFSYRCPILNAVLSYWTPVPRAADFLDEPKLE